MESLQISCHSSSAPPASRHSRPPSSSIAPAEQRNFSSVPFSSLLFSSVLFFCSVLFCSVLLLLYRYFVNKMGRIW
jgi:hypothetical protein